MFNFPLFKRQANTKGFLLLFLFFIYGLGILISLLGEVFSDKIYWRVGHVILVVSTIGSLVCPVISLFKPGFSYKGHPGMRHLPLLIAGCLIILTSFGLICVNLILSSKFNTENRSLLIPYLIVFPLHGIHSIVIYSSYFKGPTSKFGKVYQPFLPIIE